MKLSVSSFANLYLALLAAGLFSSSIDAVLEGKSILLGGRIEYEFPMLLLLVASVLVWILPEKEIVFWVLTESLLFLTHAMPCFRKQEGASRNDQ